MDRLIQPKKFIYTLAVTHEEDWGLQYDLEEESYGPALYNPYRIENSDPAVSLYKRTHVEKARAVLFSDLPEPDWEPDSDESREAAVERITKDFKKRLRVHLKRKAERAKLKGFPQKRSENLERDARWLVMDRVCGLTYKEIEERDANEDNYSADADNIKVAVNRLAKQACLNG